ncbi:hypothetical protein [Spiroplasma eriocheiris]|uniref:hypothetical protein n=1 Tax=Spiroplasma eriocheiris TaxID=315358 RepID=UPI000A7A0B82|nr:hypothetical protein [Spiroplasma eriocheiris]
MGENNSDTQKFRPDKKINFQVQNFKNWWNSKALPTISKIGNQRHFSAIRDSFGTMIPLIIAGSIGILINAIIFGGAGSNKISLLALFAKAGNPNWDWNASAFEWPTKAWADASQIGGLAFGYINIATIGAMSLYFSFLLGYFIALSRNFKQPVMAGLASFAAFIVACMGQVAFFMSAQGLITALIVGLFTSELFIWFGNMKKLEVKLPSGVPPAVGKSFAVFLPMTFTLASVALVNICFLAPAIATTGWSVDTWQNLVISSYQGGSIWQPSFGNFTISGNDFLEWVTKTGPYKDAHIDPNSLFINGATANIINGYGTASDVAGINNYFDTIRNGMTKDGYNLFGQI